VKSISANLIHFKIYTLHELAQYCKLSDKLLLIEKVMRKNKQSTIKLHEARRVLTKADDVSIPQPAKKQGRKKQAEKPAALEPVTPMTVFDDYYVILKDIGATQVVHNSCIQRTITQGSRYSVERERGQPLYRDKLEKLIAVYNRYINKLAEIDNEYQKVFSEVNFKEIDDVLQHYINEFDKSSSPFAPLIIGQLQPYKQFLSKVSAAKGNFDGFEEEEVGEVTEAVINGLSAIEVNQSQETLLKKIISEVDKIYELMGIKKQMPSDMQSIVQDIEKTLIYARLFLRIKPDQISVDSNLNINKEIIKIQIYLLELLNKNPAAKIDKWPVLNRDLIRIQERNKPILVALILTQKKQELLVFERLAVPELVTLIDVINRSDEVNHNLSIKGGNLDADLSTIKEICATNAFKQNALVRVCALTAMINCFTIKNSNDVLSGKEKVARLKSNIDDKIDYIKKFVDNLDSVKAAWNSDLFKFLNNFAVTKLYIEEVISGTEIAFLHCEVLFKSVDESNLDLKNKVIEMQIKLLEMQKTLLHFTKAVSGEEFVKRYYFRGAKIYEYIQYNTAERNQSIASSGNLHDIIEGIPYSEVEAYISARKLKLEAIPLTFLADQRKLKEADYENAISGQELEKYLNEWEKEKRAEEVREEKRKEAPTKQQNLRKQAAKEAEKAKVALKRKDEGKGEKPDKAVAAKLVVKPANVPLTQKMDELLLLLNPRAFNANEVKRVINELHPFTMDPANPDELVFKALSAIGDSYSMIAGHNLNHSSKNPKELLANLELALNFYSRAALVLDNHDDTTMESCSHYYTWLRHSIGLERQLLEQYQRRFTLQYERLLVSRANRMQKMGEEWYLNHLKPGWTKSVKSKQTETLQDALNMRSENGQEHVNAVQSLRIEVVREEGVIQTVKTQVERAEKCATRSAGTQSEQEKYNTNNAVSVLENKCRDLENCIQGKIHSIEDHRMAYSFEHYLCQSGSKPLPEQQLSYKFEDLEAAPFQADEVVGMVVSSDNANVVRIEQPETPLLSGAQMVTLSRNITFPSVISYNHYGEVYFCCLNTPPFVSPHSMMPSTALSHNSGVLTLQCNAPQVVNEANVVPDKLRAHLRFPSQHVPTVASPTVPVVPFANIPANYHSYAATCCVTPPQQPQITYVPIPPVTHKKQLKQSFNPPANPDKAR